MNNENEEEKNTVIERQEWHVKEYCCENMRRYIIGGFALKLEVHHTGELVYNGGSSGYSVIIHCPHCGAKVITK